MSNYDRLSAWAAKHGMQFKVQVDGSHRVFLWMADACDGYCGAECVSIYDGEPLWLGYRFRLRKNEAFLDKFLRLGVFEDTHDEWLGYKDSEPLFILPSYWRSEHGTWHGERGMFFWLYKEPSDAVRYEMVTAGCELLKSHPKYAPEMVSRVVFVPKGTPHLFHDSLFGTAMVGRETVGRFEDMVNTEAEMILDGMTAMFEGWAA